jgi:hypothetical protein
MTLLALWAVWRMIFVDQETDVTSCLMAAAALAGSIFFDFACIMSSVY